MALTWCPPLGAFRLEKTNEFRGRHPKLFEDSMNSSHSLPARTYYISFCQVLTFYCRKQLCEVSLLTLFHIAFKQR